MRINSPLRIATAALSIFLSLSASAKSAGQILRVDLARSTSIKLRWIPPGSFIMGSPEGEMGRLPNEHQVTVQFSKGYYLADGSSVSEMYFRKRRKA